MKIGVALSGGKDSSLAAALLLREGNEVVGYHLLLCPEKYALPPAEEQLAAVINIARRLAIKLEVIDARKEFSRVVIGDFLKAYRRGRTPNPCVLCNRDFKFGLLLRRVLGDGCEKVASGHYARVGEGKRYSLKKGVDPERDETYFLFQLSRQLLRHLLFPLGEREQTENRKLAEELLPGAAFLPPTQEACFLARVGPRRFLEEKFPSPPGAGDIIDKKGKKLGEHPGYQYYTIGQRKGLSSASGKKGPLFVTEIIPGKNQVMAGSKEDLLSSSLTASRVNWISLPGLSGPLSVRAKIRYTHSSAEATVTPLSGSRVAVEFARPQEAVTPGQAVVFYQDDLLLGGAWID